MTTSVATFVFYPNGMKHLLGAIDIVSGITSIYALLTDSSYTYNAAHEFLSSIVGEVTTNGGARIALTNVTIATSGSEIVVDCDDITWTASGGNLTARNMIIYSNVAGTDAGRQLISFHKLDDTNADITATVGRVLKYNVPATGLFRGISSVA